MKVPQIPQDDIMDVMEMMNKIEKLLNRILKDNETNLAMSALISSTINCLLSQCKTIDEVVFYRNLFMKILDNSISHIKIKDPEKPTPS